MASNVTLKAIGLNLSPNQLDVQPGGLTEASNVIIKRDNVIESRRGFKLYGTSFGTSSDRAKQLMSYKQRIIRHFLDQLQFETTSTNNNGEIVFNTFDGSYTEPEVGRRMRSIESNGNFYFTTNKGVRKISATSGNDFSTNPGYITFSGGVKALDLTGSLNFDSGSGFLPQDSAVAYRVVWAEKDVNNNLILGAPSQRFVIFNPLINLLSLNYAQTLQSLDLIASGSMINDGNYVSTLTLSPGSSAIELQTNLIALAAKLDNDILYADTVSAPLQISGASINVGIGTISFSSGNPANYFVSSSKINLKNFTPATGTLDGAQTVSTIFPAFSTTGDLVLGLPEITSVVITDISATASISSGNTFTAVTPGTIGNSISLVFNGSNDVNFVTSTWNASNPSNQVTFTGLGTNIPLAQTVNLTNGDFISNHLAGSYFNINSAKDKTQYYVWFQTSGVGVDPQVTGRKGIQVNIANNDVTSTVASQIATAVSANIDFTAVAATNTVTITTTSSGATTASFAGTSGFAVTQTQAGVSGDVITSVADTSGVVLGGIITGTGIPANTYVTEIGLNTLTISNGATIAGTGVSLNFDAGITFNTTASGIVTTALPSIYSNEYRSITQPSIPSPTPTNQQLVDLQTYLSTIITRLQNEPVAVIPSYLSTAFIQSLVITTSSNVNLTITIPADIDSSMFFQVYRSPITSATGVNTVNDLSPSDELQQVYEAYPTSAELSAGVINIVDVTPDAFRGANLYTNPTTGEGILQSNDDPPVCKDIARFKGCLFFANTSTKQRLSINLLGVTNMINDYNNGTIPSFTISNGTSTQTYTFTVGAQEATQFTTVADVAGSLNGKYFTFNSANNVAEYYGFLNTGITNISVANPTVITSNGHGLSNGDSITIVGSNSTPSVDGTYTVSGVTANTFTIPVNVTSSGNTGRWIKNISGKIGIRVDINIGETANNVALKCSNAINALIDTFGATSSTNTFLVINVDEGYTTDASAQTSGFTVTVITQGKGENAANNEILLSNLASPARAVDATARSLLHVVNLTTGGLVYAYYLSGANDVPGKIFIETRSLGVDPFYILGNNSNTGSSFSPDISPTLTISSNTAANPTIITTTTPHGLTNKDKVMIAGSNSTPSIDGLYEITYINSTQFSINVNVTVAGTRGALIKSTDAIFSDNETQKHRVYYSKFQQPESVPLVNYVDIGAQDKQILRIFALRDSLFVFKEDGLFRISGETAPWNVALFDSSCIVLAPDSVDVSNNLIYAWTTQGVVSVSEAGVSIISRPIDTEILKLASSQYTGFKTATWGVGYESDNSYTVWTVQQTTDTIAQIGYRFSTLTNSWTTFNKSNTCGIVDPRDDKLYLGAGDTNFIEQERKNFTRYDYADREFDITLAQNNYLQERLQLNSVQDLVAGDVCVQTQYLTVYEFNQILQKMDLDPYLSPHDYSSTQQIVSGVNIRNSLDSLINKVANDPGRLSIIGATPASDYLKFQSVGGTFTITDISATSPAIVTTSVPHNLQTGRVVTITSSNSIQSIDGIHQIVVTGPSTFSVALAVTVPGTAGSISVENDDFLDVQSSYNSLMDAMNNDIGVAFSNYTLITESTDQEAIIVDVNTTNKIITLDLVLPFLVGPIKVYKAIDTKITWAPNTFGDPLGLKHIREATLMFENKAFTTAKMIFSTDLLPVLKEVPFKGDGNGIFGHIPHFGMNYFGGNSHGAPFRTIVPRDSQRCRYMICSFEHAIAREQYALYGISLTGEVGQSTRAYR